MLNNDTCFKRNRMDIMTKKTEMKQKYTGKQNDKEKVKQKKEKQTSE